MSQYKKTGIALATLLIAGGGVMITSDYFQRELNAAEIQALSEFKAMSPDFSVSNVDKTSSRYYLAGSEFETTYDQNGSIKMMSTDSLGVLSYAEAMQKVEGIATSIPTEEQKIVIASRIPADTDLTVDGSTAQVGGTLDIPYRTSFEYWTGKENDTTNGQLTVFRDNGAFGVEQDFYNNKEHEQCGNKQTILGRLTQEFTVEAKTVTEDDKVLMAHAYNYSFKKVTNDDAVEITKNILTCKIHNDMELQETGNMIYLANKDALPTDTCSESSSTIAEYTDDTSVTFYASDITQPIGNSTLPANTYFLKGINGDTLIFESYGGNNVLTKGADTTGSVDTPIKTKKTYECTAAKHPEEKADTRALIEVKKDSLLFSSENHTLGTKLSKQTEGKYLTADGSSRLKMKGLEETNLAKDYEIRNGNNLRIPRDTIKKDLITIPLDFSGSTYVSSTNSDFTSTPVIFAKYVNTTTQEEKTARLTTKYDAATGKAVAELNIADIMSKGANDVYDTQDVTITFYQNELVSKDGNDKYVDYLSDGQEIKITLIDLIPASALTLESDAIEDVDDPDAWGTSNTIKGHFDYPKLVDETIMKPNYTITQNGQATKKEFTIASDGSFTFADLPEGEYDLKVVIPVKDDTVEKTLKMKVDTKQPVLEKSNYDEVNVYAKKVDLKLHVEALSGVKSLQLIKAVDTGGVPIAKFTTPIEIKDLWSDDTISKDASISADGALKAGVDGVDYKFTTDKAGYYSFKVTANNGLTYTIKDINLTKIYDGSFAASLEAYTYSDVEDPKPVKVINTDGSADWAANRVELHLSTQITGAIGSGITWEYYEYDPANPVSEIPEDAWKPVIDSNGKPSDKFHVDNEGTYFYKFRAKSIDQTITLPSDKNIGLTETDFYAVKIDLIGPNKPELMLAPGIEYTNKTWFSEEQKIKAAFTPSDTLGSKETLQYRFVDDNGDFIGTNWADYPSDSDDAKNFILVNSAGSHHLQFQVIDELGRTSSITKADINMDMNAPVMDKLTYGANEIKQWAHEVTGGLFFKDYIEVSASASDTDSNDVLTYQYVFVTREKADLNINGQPQYVPTKSEWQEGQTARVSSDFDGIVMMRALDRAGNSTAIWYSDGIKIDRIGPSITFPELSDSGWSDETSVKVNIVDGGTKENLKSQIKADSVKWYSASTGVTTPLILDTNGDGEITGLVDGSYVITISAEDNVGHPASVTKEVKIDTLYPTLTVTGHDASSIKKKETLTLIPGATTSGIEKITWSINDVDQPDITNFDDEGNATLDITTNGVYKFTAHSKAGRTSAATILDVKNLSDAKPEIEILSLIGSNPYTNGDWSKDSVSLTVKNKTADMYSLKMYYRAYKIDGKKPVEVTPKTGETYTDKTKGVWAQTDSVINVEDTGEYLYTFMAVATNGEISEKKSINVRIDKHEVPEVIITKETDFTKDMWYPIAQSITATFTDPNPAVSKTLEYRINDGQWTSVAKGKAITISTSQENKIDYRISDGLGRTSNVKTVYANIDTVTPEFTYTVDQMDGSAQIDLTPVVGASGIQSFTIQKNGSSDIKNIEGNSVNLTEMGTYQVVLTSKAGKSVTKSVEIKSITTVKPVLHMQVLDINDTSTISKDASISGNANPDIYTYENGKWSGTGSKWSDHGVKVKTSLVNSDKAGNVTYYVNMDSIGWKEAIPEADGTLVLKVGEDNTYENVVNYQIKAISESGVESDVQSITLYIDKQVPTTFNVNGIDADGKYNGNAFVNTTQILTTDFVKAKTGAKEWLEYYVEDSKGNVVFDNVVQDTLTLSDSGIYTVKVRNMDDLGRTNHEVEFMVHIDKEIPTELTAEVAGNSFKEFLSDITMGLFFKNSEELTFSADFGVSGGGKIYYQNVSDQKDYQLPEITSAWSVYTTTPIQLPENSYGIYYFYAVDDAGNNSAVYKTDGLTVDMVAPAINVQLPTSANGWSNQSYVEVTTNGDDTQNEQAKGLNKGFKELKYTTDEDTPQSGSIVFDAQGKAKIQLHDGSYNLMIQGVDYADNEVVASGKTKAAGNSFQIQIDTVKPTMKISGHKESEQAQKELLKIDTSIGASGYKLMDATGTFDPAGDKVIRVEKTTDTGTTTQGLSLIEAQSYEVNENGTYTFMLQNNVGTEVSETLVINNISTTLPSMEVVMDHDDGSGNTLEYKESTWSATDVNLHMKAVKDGTFKYRIHAQSDEWLDSNGDITISAEGRTQVSVRLIVNNTIIEEQTYDIRIDKSGPQAPYVLEKDLIEMMDTWYKDTFNVKADMDKDVTGCFEHIQYSMDNGTTWSDGDNVNVTMPGINTILFRSIDELGRTASDSDSSEVKVKIDITAPTALRVKIEEDGFSSFLSDVTFNIFKKTQKVVAFANFNQSGADRFEYQVIQKGEVYDSTTGWIPVEVSGDNVVSETLTKLEDGFHGIVYVRAVDQAGNISSIVTSENIIVDQTDPTINAEDMSDWSKDNTYAFAVEDLGSGIDRVTYQYQPKQGTAGTEQLAKVEEDGSVILQKLANGEGTLILNAYDQAGNHSTKSVNVKFDTNKPSLGLRFENGKLIANVTYNGQSGIKRVIVYGPAIHETDITDTMVEVNGQYQYEFTPQVSSTYVVKVETNAGNEDTKQLEISSVVTDKPVLKVDPVYTQSDRKGMEYKEGDWSLGNIDITVSNVADNVHAEKFFYTIYEKDGTTIVQNEKEIKASDGAYIQAIDQEGTHVIALRAVSGDGISSETTKLTVRIDRSVPHAPIVTKAEDFEQDDWYNTTKYVTASFTANPDGASETLTYNLDGEVTTDHKLIWRTYDVVTGVGIMEEGQHVVRFRVEKSTGAISDESAPAYVNIDMSKPSDMVIEVDDVAYRHFLNAATFGAYFKDTSKVTIKGNFDISGMDKIEYAILPNPPADADIKEPADADFTPYTGAFYLDPNIEVIVFARGYDQAGNRSDVIFTDRLKIDNVEPTITFPDYKDNKDGVPVGWMSENSLRVEALDSDSGIERVEYKDAGDLSADSVAGEAYKADDGYYLIPNIPNGSFYLNVIAYDQAGNSYNRFVALNVDMIKPNFTISRNDTNQKTQFTIDATKIEVGPSKVKELKIAYENKEGKKYSEVLKEENGVYTFEAFENATYTFTLTNGAGIQTVKQEVVDTIDVKESGIIISPVSESDWQDVPALRFEAYAMPRNNVLRYSYTQPGGNIVEDITTMDNQHSFELRTSGKYHFTFTSRTPDNPDSVVETRDVDLWIDNDIPNTPVVQGAYDKEHYYSSKQQVTAINKKTSLASDEILQYRVDPADDSAAWIDGGSVGIDPLTLGYTTHTVEFRVIDEVGHTSKISEAIVNFSKAADLRMSVGYASDKPMPSIPMKITVTTGNAPLASLSVRNTAHGEDQIVDIPVDKTIVNRFKEYGTIINQNGTYLITATDQSGNVRTMEVQVTNIQLMDTDIDVTLRNSYNQIIKSGSWSAVDVTLKASNTTTSDLSGIYYCVDNDTTWIPYSGSIKVKDEGKFVYHFKLTQNGKDYLKDVHVYIDKSEPNKPIVEGEDQYGSELWKASEAALIEAKLDNASDTGAPQSMQYRVDSDSDADWKKGSVARVNGNGTHHVDFIAVDEAGNLSEVKSVTVNLDAQPPVMEGIQATKDRLRGVYTVEITAKDDHGIRTLQYQKVASGNKPIDGAYESVEPVFVNEDNAGKHYTYTFHIDDGFRGYIFAKAEDLAGNTSNVMRSNLVDADFFMPEVSFPAGDMERYTKENSIQVHVDYGENGPATDGDALAWVAYDEQLKAPLLDAQGDPIEGKVTSVTDSGTYTIDNLPNGNYRVVVKAKNKAGNVNDEKNMHVLIEHIDASITTNVGPLINEDHARTIKVQMNYNGEHLRPDTMAVKKGLTGEWEVVKSYNAITGTLEYTVTENGSYYFKVYQNSDPETAIISNEVKVEGIVAIPGAIQMEDYIKFISGNTNVCDNQAAGNIKNDKNGQCTFDEYRMATSYDVNVVLLNWEELTKKMQENGLELVSATQVGDQTTDFKTVDWKDADGFPGTKLLDTYSGKLAKNEYRIYALRKIDGSNEIVAKRAMKIWILDSGGSGIRTFALQSENTPLRLSAKKTYMPATNEAYQLVKAGEALDEANWQMNEEITLEEGAYTLYVKDALGEIEHHEIETSFSTITKETNTVRSTLKAMTFHLLYKDDLKLTIQSDLSDIEYYMQGEWHPYTGSIMIDSLQATGSIQIRGINAVGAKVNEFISLN